MNPTDVSAGFAAVATRIEALVAAIGANEAQFSVTAPVPSALGNGNSIWKLDSVAQPGDFYVFEGTLTYTSSTGARVSRVVSGVTSAGQASRGFLQLVRRVPWLRPVPPVLNAYASPVAVDAEGTISSFDQLGNDTGPVSGAVHVYPAIFSTGGTYRDDVAVASSLDCQLVLTTSRLYHLN